MSGVSTAYRECERIAREHYENFTVASRLLPRELRRHVAAIYAFARLADDMADEGDSRAAERRARLDAWQEELHRGFAGRASHPVVIALGQSAVALDLPVAPFERLLDAFRSDVDFRPFATFAELREYCRRSADPVGHLVLHLFGHLDERRRELADEICTGLQLANFLQDVSVDAARGRVYLPLEDLARFGCSADQVLRGADTPALRRVIAFEAERARRLLVDGARLAGEVRPRLGFQLRLFAGGGLAILDRIERSGFAVLANRPTLSRTDRARLVTRALLASGVQCLRPASSLPASAGADHAGSGDGSGAGDAPGAGRGSAAGRGDDGSGTPNDAGLAADYAACREVTRRSSTSFFRAFQLLPAERRRALHAVYAFCRFVDDVADEPTRDPAALLARWREELDRAYDGGATRPVSRALSDATRRFPLAREHFLELIRGVESDLTRRRYESFAELRGYCYRVASTVGLLCIEVFGYQSPSARDYAVDLGIALQLTNILRDVWEDARRGRIYLPLEDLRQFGCSEQDLLRGRYSPRIAALLAFECGRARAHYLRAAGSLSAVDRLALAPAEAMRLTYQRLLDRIEARRFDVFGPPIRVAGYEKISAAALAWGRSRLGVRRAAAAGA